MQHLVLEVEAGEERGMTAPQAIADHFTTPRVSSPARAGAGPARLWPNSSAARAPNATVRVEKRRAW
ncbi:MAG: hypothetical protein CFH36_01870 [Alphaproteobacteria bacterium MarineAlpha9_Bin6]|nr:MAG: hypothetical protein CFH36_01870 [Alphaproteobacteria bacterium MarineAlpha9_Bin6]